MIMVCVRLEILQIFLQIRRINLPIFFRKLQHLMPGVLDRPGFMNTHVPCLRCYYASYGASMLLITAAFVWVPPTRK